MPDPLRSLFICALLTVAAAPSLRADLDGGVDLFPSSYDIDSSTEPLRKTPTTFARRLAQKADWPLEKIEKLERKGYGRTEIISLIEIARRSPKTWDDLVKERDKGKKMRELAEEAALNYNEVFRRAQKLRDEINAEVEGQLPDSGPRDLPAGPGGRAPGTGTAAP